MKAKTKRVLAAVLAAVMILPSVPYGDGVLVANASNVSDSLEMDKEVPEEEKVSEDGNIGNEEKPNDGNDEVTETPGDGDVMGDEEPGDGNTEDGDVPDDGNTVGGETPDDEITDSGEMTGGGGRNPRIMSRKRETPQRNVSMLSGAMCHVRTAHTR
ncbi:MAG: hypothetical protein K2I53_10955 [Lachnospiraceae bacterium]|nr:hypothetical protein [Lachnospiraceae bacterium]